MKWVIILGSASFFIFCDTLAYKWAKHNGSNWLLPLVAILGGIGYLGFCLVCTYVPLGSTPMVGVIVALGAVTVGYLVFGETLTWQQALGVVCALAAVVLLSYHKAPEVPPPI